MWLVVGSTSPKKKNSAITYSTMRLLACSVNTRNAGVMMYSPAMV